jgi:hypothetical protein
MSSNKSLDNTAAVTTVSGSSAVLTNEGHTQVVPKSQEVTSLSSSKVVAASERRDHTTTTTESVMPGKRKIDDDNDDNDDSDEIENLTPQSVVVSDRAAERQAFLKAFEQHMISHLKTFRRQYPYRQKIRWSIEFEDGADHTFHILLKPPRSTNNQ